MIQSILDTDLYKFTTSYAYMKLFPDAEGTFEFIDRNNTIYSKEFIEDLKLNLNKLSQLKINNKEFNYVNTIRFIPSCYWEWLSGFQFELNKININLDEENHLHITVTDILYKATLYEVPILAIVSELCNKYNKINISLMLSKLVNKLECSNLNKLMFSEFGTRRRFSYEVQNEVLACIKLVSKYCTGTSNVYLAMKYNMNCIGTHPHEWFMFHGAIYGYRQANYLALENWVNVYDGDLGIALSDTYTSDVFLKNFSRKHAKLFDGIRHDSGDPFLFVDKVINRYKELGIDPTTKTIIFSNALTFPLYNKINDYCKNKINSAAGIGTNLTNDTEFKCSNIVMKLTSCKMNNNQSTFKCVKLSDDLGKHTGDIDEVERCIATLNT